MEPEANLAQEAMERRLRECRRQKLYAYGEEQARKLGIREEDVERVVHEFRQEERGTVLNPVTS